MNQPNINERLQLGAFEEIVLLTVAQIGENSYGVSIRQAVEAATGRDTSIGAIYATLERLEQKGFITSRMGEATKERGGKPKKHFRIEGTGQMALEEVESARQRIKRGVVVGITASA